MTPTNPGDSTAMQLTKWQDKFDLVLKWYRGDTAGLDLPKDLEVQRLRWMHIYGLLSTGKYPKDTQVISAILKAFPEISQRTAYNYLRDTRRFYASLNEPDLAFERVALIMEMKDDMRIAKKKGDLRSLAALRKVYATLIGADKAAEVVENKTIINIINYNPVMLGGEEIDEATIDKMVAKLLADDKKKQDKEFDTYEDVDN